ncbi:hypothetical protein [Actinokineospora terrae]|uniref:Uncharacterized protein n=1 Tax=Actinokineospora terrae TaxID=155974 RepID=A0A1H9VHF8_9PSEU|nr:hypothetical protein [Actinokineospora terrae]SES20971.1 hypothetical protein SAMN04487818_108363 [Actinokineospora terrae]
MRLILSVLLVGILLAIPAVVMADAVLDREARDDAVANDLGTQFLWPKHPRVADPEVALRILAEAATATGSNVLRTTVDISGRKHIRHYIFVSGDRTALFDGFTLAAGRWLNSAESRAGSATVSSVRAGEVDNVGVPVVFGDRYELTFAPLGRAFESLPTAGRYTVESPDRDRFLTLVARGLVVAGVAGASPASLTSDVRPTPVATPGDGDVLAYILTGLATFVLAVILLREGKRIGVFRSVGYPTARILYRVVGRPLIASLLIGLATCLVVTAVVPGVDTVFLRTLVVALGRVVLVGFVATTGVGLVLVNRVRMSDLIKGRLQ